MDNEQKRYVTMKNPPESGHSEPIFAEFGKVYEILPIPEGSWEPGPNGFYISLIPEEPASFCLFKDCAHLLGGEWAECDAEGNRLEEED